MTAFARVVVAVHSREVKAGLFLALSGVDSLTIVASASSSAELVTYCRTFRPEIAIVERGLPGRPMDETLRQLDDVDVVGKVLVIDGGALAAQVPNIEVFLDVDDLVAALPVTTTSED